MNTHHFNTSARPRATFYQSLKGKHKNRLQRANATLSSGGKALARGDPRPGDPLSHSYTEIARWNQSQGCGEGRQPPLGTKTLRNQDRLYLMQHSEKIQKLMQKPHNEQNIKILNKNRPVVWILPFASGPYVTLYGTLPAPSFK